jgi:hypothetical protein
MSAGFEGVDIHWIRILDCPVDTGQSSEILADTGHSLDSQWTNLRNLAEKIQ